MDLNLKGHAAIVQGASKGIGRGIAEALAAEGCDLVITARNEAVLRETAEEIARVSGREVIPAAADSADLNGIDTVVERARKEFGRLDIVVCNSGGPPPGAALDLSPEAWSDAARLLLASPVALLKAALPLLKESPAPRFFIVTSSSTRQPVPGLTLSNVLRPGIVGLIKVLADELAPHRVRCHSIAPGRFDTDRLGHVITVQAKNAGKSEDEIRAAMIDSIPAGRLGAPRELGDLVAYLASEKADYLTGGNWLVDGGLIRAL